MTAFLIDAMFPVRTAVLLRDDHRHDATHVAEMDMDAADDADIAVAAKATGRILVTENVKDFAAVRGLVILCVLKRNLPTGGALPSALAKTIDHWARSNPTPYPGMYWPTVT